MTEMDREEASEIVKNAFGRRPDLQDGKDYVDEVRGHEQNELRERVARIICCFAVGNNNCAECEENTDPGHKFPDCFWDIRQETDQLFALYAGEIGQAKEVGKKLGAKEERERIILWMNEYCYEHGEIRTRRSNCKWCRQALKGDTT